MDSSKTSEILEYCSKNKGLSVKELTDYSLNNNLNWEKDINDNINLIKEYLSNNNNDDEIILENN